MQKFLKAFLAASFALVLAFTAGCAKGGAGGDSASGSAVGSAGNSVGSSSGGGSGAEGLKIEKVAAENGKIAVYLNAKADNMVAADLSVQAFGSDWYSLKPQISDRLTVTDTAVSEKDGKTVVTYTVAENAEGGYLADEFVPPVKSDEDKALIVGWANNAVTWQLPSGGWYKEYDAHIAETSEKYPHYYKSKGWTDSKGDALGTIDNDSTYSEMRLLAEAYEISGEEKFRTGFLKGMEFIKKLQYPSGGLSQVYPLKKTYNDYVTYNDDAMINVLIMLEDLAAKKYPFIKLYTDELKAEAEAIIEKGIDYILKSQITVGGEKAAWCAQHHPTTYAPMPARAYELASVSGSESIGIIKFLFHQRNNPEAIAAAEAALNWLAPRRMENTDFDKNGITDPATGEVRYFFEKEGKNLWWRFYDLETGEGFFSDRDGGKYFDIAEISAERRTGYSWTGTWPQKLLNLYSDYGYYPNRVIVTVTGSETTSKIGGFTVGDFAVAS